MGFEPKRKDVSQKQKQTKKKKKRIRRIYECKIIINCKLSCWQDKLSI